MRRWRKETEGWQMPNRPVGITSAIQAMPRAIAGLSAIASNSVAGGEEGKPGDHLEVAADQEREQQQGGISLQEGSYQKGGRARDFASAVIARSSTRRLSLPLL